MQLVQCVPNCSERGHEDVISGFDRAPDFGPGEFHATAGECLGVLGLAVPVTETGNENPVTKGGSGAHLAPATLQAALYNVRITLGSIEDGAFGEAVDERTEEIEVAAADDLDQVEENVSAVR